ncbi:hypothetical protein DE146DRAFT_454671 [Phaeosphaeria sp. MPI-PUGE-AT-0046c]|nr:hypothetical protein DE146DRAFT_454671 [Phaeosphaeria sp. MPI-PUGE-AT-0046c]
MSERSTHHHHPPAHSQPPQGLTFHGYQPEADAHRPTNARRQDSAICHLIRPGTAKEASSLVRPSEPDVASSHRSPDSSRHSTSPTSPGHVLSHSRAPALPTTSHEHVTTSSTPYPQAAPELSNRTHSPLHSDSPQASSTRQTKYNVRFAANHTPENMPSAQRPRHSPPPPVAVQPTEMAPPQEAPERPATPQAEPVRPPVIDRSQIISIIMGHQNGNSQPEPHVDEGVERCPGCGEAWSRTPANAAVLLGHKQVQTHHDYARNMDNYHENLRQFEKENGEAFDQWKKKHSQCPVAPVAPPQANTPAGHSSKRKSEGLHEDVSRKRPTLNGHAATAPPVQSTTPT